MKYLGIDVGKKNIGVAVGEIIASELTTLRTKEESFYTNQGMEEAAGALKKIIEEEQIDVVVAGLPVNEDGGETEESAKIRKFGDFLENYLNISVHFVDETLTSFMAKDILESQGVSQSEIDERVDQMSASLILQQYLEENALA